MNDNILFWLLLALAGWVLTWRESCHDLNTYKIKRQLQRLEKNYNELVNTINKIEKYYKTEKLFNNK